MTSLNRAIFELEAIYRDLPTIACQGLCADSCGPIPLQDAEAARIEKRLRGPIPPYRMRCPLLTLDGRCSVYGIRPLICRMWGVVESMPCVYGCKPDPRYLTNEEGYAILERAQAAGGRTVYLGGQSSIAELMAVVANLKAGRTWDGKPTEP